MVGSVYVKFSDEEGAAAALQGLQGRFYGGRPIQIEFSPVTDFREATCRQYEENTCTRGGYCNFMHLRPISRYLFITVISIAVKLKIHYMHMEEIQQCFCCRPHTHICIALLCAKLDFAHIAYSITSFPLLQRSAEGSVWAVQEEGESRR